MIDNFHIKIGYTYTHSSYDFKRCIGFVLLNCAIEKKCGNVCQNLCNAIKLFECQKYMFEMRNKQYSVALSFHIQPSVFCTTYTIQRLVNFPIIFVSIDLFHFYCNTYIHILNILSACQSVILKSERLNVFSFIFFFF